MFGMQARKRHRCNGFRSPTYPTTGRSATRSAICRNGRCSPRWPVWCAARSPGTIRHTRSCRNWPANGSIATTTVRTAPLVYESGCPCLICAPHLRRPGATTRLLPDTAGGPLEFRNPFGLRTGRCRYSRSPSSPGRYPVVRDPALAPARRPDQPGAVVRRDRLPAHHRTAVLPRRVRHRRTRRHHVRPQRVQRAVPVGAATAHIVAIYPMMATIAFEIVRNLGCSAATGRWSAQCASGRPSRVLRSSTTSDRNCVGGNGL